MEMKKEQQLLHPHFNLKNKRCSFTFPIFLPSTTATLTKTLANALQA